jgi:hypothetical protein
MALEMRLPYHYWRLARQKDDLQERSRLIAQGLRFAESPEPPANRSSNY